MNVDKLEDEGNRLKKLPNGSENIYGRPPKLVLFDDSLRNPSAVSLHYGNKPHTYVVDSRGIPLPLFPPKQYEDNKCINRCKYTIHMIWMLILMLYVLVIPIIMFQLNSKIQEVKEQVWDVRNRVTYIIVKYQTERKISSINTCIPKYSMQYTLSMHQLLIFCHFHPMISQNVNASHKGRR